MIVCIFFSIFIVTLHVIELYPQLDCQLNLFCLPDFPQSEESSAGFLILAFMSSFGQQKLCCKYFYKTISFMNGCFKVVFYVEF